MLNQFSRTELLLGHNAMERLSKCRVAVFGIGGVGGYTVEALVRSGIGAIDLIDDDWVDARSYKKILTTLKSFVEGEEPDMVIANYVYDKVGAKRKKVIHYDNVFPV